MIKEDYTHRILEIAAEHLNCALDDNEPGYVPPDLIVGSYRWYLYMYSNMYKKDDHCMSAEDRAIFKAIALKFKREHLICWTRDTLIEIDKSKMGYLLKFIIDKIMNTNSLFELRVCLYTVKSLRDVCPTTDSYVLELLPEMKEFIIDEKV